MNLGALSLVAIPECPQASLARNVSTVLWSNREVKALWLGGSFGRGTWDAESDLDFRLLASATAIERMLSTRFEEILGTTVLAESSLNLGSYYVRHCITGEGVFLDLALLADLKAAEPEQIIILGARDEETFAELEAIQGRIPARGYEPVSSEFARQLILDFWMNSAKHRKVLRRGCGEIVALGLHNEQLLILRLLYILATGEDTNRELFTGIHGLSKLLTEVRRVSPYSLPDLFGQRRRNPEEIVQVIKAHREVVSSVGRALADRLSFSYPQQLEEKITSLALP